ncbi:maleylacetoacetate isomerase [Sphingomonas sp. MG17]|uniref:Maleylacetoacetate isomerase n=1 Tax=Sphingomonas tagetis TaxID=2949092 RepID=A0A9X2HKF4_9SPHN|nr:maleylacetoacetate isomerase [Sphingomonas tagetis]MCP3730296.1 maleylacetoacetate isomerase [Sphingomonas tagetis]
MKLHHFAHSSASYRVRMVLALKQIEISYVTVDMPAQEQTRLPFAALNPQRMVPCLELDDGRVIPQSLAIIDYLEGLVPEPSVYPADPVLRSQALALALFIGSETAPLQTRLVRRILAESFGFDEAADQRWITTWIRRGLEHANAFLAASDHAGTFTFGETPGIADIFIVPQLRNAARFGVATDDLTELNRLDAVAKAHPALAKAHPDAWL